MSTLIEAETGVASAQRRTDSRIIAGAAAWLGLQTYYARVDSEHRGMVDAIAKRDPKAAEQLARQHTVLFRERVITYLSESRSDEIALS